MVVQCRVTPTIILQVPQETHRSHRRPTPQSIYFSPGWDVSPMQGYPHNYITSTTGDTQKPQEAYTSKYLLLPWMGCWSNAGLPPALYYEYHRRPTEATGGLHLKVFTSPPGWDASLSHGYPQHYNTGTTADIQEPQGAYRNHRRPTPQSIYFSPGWDAGLMQGYHQDYITSTTADPQKPQEAYTSKYLLLPLDGMVVQCRVTTTIILQVPQETHKSHRRPTPQSIYFSPWMGCWSNAGLPPALYYEYHRRPTEATGGLHLKVFTSPLDGMVVQCRVTPTILYQVPQQTHRSHRRPTPQSIYFSPGWDAGPMQGYHQHYITSTTGDPQKPQEAYTSKYLLLPPGWDVSPMQGYPHNYITSTTGDPQKPQEAYTSKYLLLPWMGCWSNAGLPPALYYEYHRRPTEATGGLHLKVFTSPPGWDGSSVQGYHHHYITSTTGDPQKPQEAYTSKYLLLPLDGMLVQCRVTTSIILRVPQDTHRSQRRPTPQSIYFSPWMGC